MQEKEKHKAAIQNVDKIIRNIRKCHWKALK